MTTDMALPTGYSTKWKVNSSIPWTDVDGGSPRTGQRITFTTSLGHQGEVFIPNSVPTADDARLIIADQVKRVDEIASLTE